MDFDHCVYRLYEIARSEEEEISSCFRQLAFDVSKNGITGLVPTEEGGIEAGVPSNRPLPRNGSDFIKKDSESMEKLYQDLFAEEIDGYR
ncbi:MAG TPA: hypothetical protein VK118_06950 [Tetragenococcus sp.]|nr:hypothetical protein [Tetragenococcus sp.]